MSGLLEMMARVTQVKDNPEAICEKSLNDCAPKIVELQIAQMKEGIDSTGQPIQWQRDSHYPYTNQYAKRKAGWGGQVRVVDLRGFTGEYYAQMQAHAANGLLTIKSLNEKAAYLEENYNKDKINGLTDDNVHVLIEEELDTATILNVKEVVKL